MSKLSIQDAARRWLEQFDHVPASVIEKMAKADEAMSYYESDSLRLVAGPRIVCDPCNLDYEGPSTLSEMREHAMQGRGIPCDWCDHTPGDQWREGFPTHAFPVAWSTLFAPRDRLDQNWILEHAEAVAKLGLYVFQSEDYGCLLGIDGAGFDFDEAFWIPLYRLRGLKWHDFE
jgi:hypothetical protein